MLAPEDQLLLAGARTDPDAERDREIAALLEGRLDWAVLLETARHHAVSGMLYATLVRFPQVPVQVLEALQFHYHANRERAQKYYREVGPLLESLEAAGLSCLLLKGGALALTVYPDWGMRWFHDFDLLVRVEDVGRLPEVLEGFEIELPVYPSRWHARWAWGQPEQKWIRGSLVLDVHWSLLSGEFSARIWERALWVEREGIRVRVPAPTQMLIHLVAHMHRHLLHGGVNRLNWYCDIAELVRQQGAEIDWTEVVTILRREGVGLAAVILSLVREGLGAPVPEAVLLDLWNSAAPLPAWEKIYAVTVKALPGPAAYSTRAHSGIYNLSQIRGLRDYWAYLVGYLFPSLDFMEMRYHTRRPRVYWWYLGRLGGLVAAGGAALLAWLRFPLQRSLAMEAYQEIARLARRGK